MKSLLPGQQARPGNETLYSAKKFAVRHHDGAKIEQTKCKIRDNAQKIRELKKQFKLCDAVFVSSDRVLESVASEIKPVTTNKESTDQQIYSQFLHGVNRTANER